MGQLVNQHVKNPINWMFPFFLTAIFTLSLVEMNIKPGQPPGSLCAPPHAGLNCNPE